MEQHYDFNAIYPTDQIQNPLSKALRQLREIHGSGKELPFVLVCWQIQDIHRELFEQGGEA